MPDTPPVTRYEKVKEILDRAAAGSAVDYDGLGRFWQLRWNDFFRLKSAACA